MCGICGYISKTEYDGALLKEMNETMIHRGPNDGGEYHTSFKDGTIVGMAQRRLSILDLSAAGHQPMISEDGHTIIVYNGEVYNFIELKKELEIKGYSFKSNCDTEVILYLYLEHGKEFLKLLNGMFAIAIVDTLKQELILARDRIGKKPLYYYVGSDEIVFASELKPIMKYPTFRKDIRTELISSYLVHKSIASPDTIFKNTYKVEPGQIITWKSGTIIKEMYWNLLEVFNSNRAKIITDYTEAKLGLEKLLYDSIEKRLIADVPIGTFLSGGIDSTIVSAIAKNIVKGPLKTFTIGFTSKEENEAQYAKEISKYLGTDHTEIYVTENELFEQVRDLVKYYDEPFSDSSQIPTMLVSKLAKEDVSVVLSGDGGDELFCGYEDYDWILWTQRLDGIGELGYKFINLPGIRKINVIDWMPERAGAFLNNRDTNRKIQLFDDIREVYTKKMVKGESVSSKYAYETEIHKLSCIEKEWQTQRMLLDMRYYLADEVLVKTDRASMKYSLEVRCPIIDYRIIEYSFMIPHKYKYCKGNKKYILKDIAYAHVPRELLDRPKKGFGVPLTRWLRHDLHDELIRYADFDILERQGIFEGNMIHEFIKKLSLSDSWIYSSVLWGFFVFQMWYQEWIEDLW